MKKPLQFLTAIYKVVIYKSNFTSFLTILSLLVFIMPLHFFILVFLSLSVIPSLYILSLSLSLCVMFYLLLLSACLLFLIYRYDLGIPILVTTIYFFHWILSYQHYELVNFCYHLNLLYFATFCRQFILIIV